MTSQPLNPAQPLTPADRTVPTPPSRAGLRHGARYPAGWEVTSEDHEYLLVRLPPDVTRVTASMRLALEAEFGGWELFRVRLYSDGSRKVLLKRKKPPRARRRDESQSGPNHPPSGEDAHAC